MKMKIKSGWVAKDADGCWSWYAMKPKMGVGAWYPVSADNTVPFDLRTDCIDFGFDTDCDWDMSLHYVE